MATYIQWNKNRPVRKVTWVCGPEHALVQEVLAEHNRLELDRHSYYLASTAEEPQLWDSLLSWPRGGSLAVVYNAERLTLLDRFEVLVEAVPDLAHVVFCADADDFARTEAGGKHPLAAHLAAIQASKDGQLVRCCRPSREEDLLRVIASWWPGAGANLAAEVLARTGGDLESAWAACKTAEAAGLVPAAASLDLACQQTPVVQYATHLLAGQTREAATEAARMSEAGVGGTLKYLTSQLGTLYAYHGYAALGLDADQVARKGIPRWQQLSLAPVAAGYGAERVTRCRKLLAMAEDAFRSGVRVGILEAVATLW